MISIPNLIYKSCKSCKGGATCEDEDSEGDRTRLETLRRRTMALMRKTAQYASETGITETSKTGIIGVGTVILLLGRVNFSNPNCDLFTH